MIVKCNKTGKILFSMEEATKHAEDIGSQDFTEVAADAKVFVDLETKRRVFWSMDEVQRLRQRTRQPDFQVTEVTVAEYQTIVQEHAKKYLNDATVINYAKSKIITVLCEVKGISVLRAEKACWFTQNKGVSEAAAWLEAHKSDADIDVPLRLKNDDASPGGGNKDSGDADTKTGEGEDKMDEDQVGEAAGATESGETATENAKFVKERINEALLKDIMEMGFPQLRAEKALYISGNISVVNAVNWLTEHADDDDIDKPILEEKPAKPKMTKEEAEKAAFELQQKLRREREAREKQEAKDKEKARIESQKMIRETAAKMEEDERKRDIERLKRQKRQHAEHASQLKEQLRLDYIERFGHEPPEEMKEEMIKEKTPKQQVAFFVSLLQKNHKASNRDGLKTCLSTLKLYATNAKANPTESKYHRIKKANKGFSERVAPFPEALDLMRAMGFKDEEDPEFFQIPGAATGNSTADGFILGEALKFIDLLLGQL